jgi:hypothetical protein
MDQKIKNEFEALIDSLTKLADLEKNSDQQDPLLFGTDEALPLTGLEICTDHATDTWISADRNLWRSWTGRRKIWGIEYHGPVYNLDSPEDSAPWSGIRSCSCQICQKNVDDHLKPN